MKQIILATLLMSSAVQAGFFSDSESAYSLFDSIAGEYSSSDHQYCHNVSVMLGSDSSDEYTGLSPEDSVGKVSMNTVIQDNGYTYGYAVHFSDEANVDGNKLVFKTNHMGAEYGDVSFGNEWQRTEITVYRKGERLSRIKFATWKYNPLNPFSKKPLISQVTGKTTKKTVECRF